MTLDALLARARGEYREMPDLRLTLPQAARLWHVDPVTCRAILDALVAEGFLGATPKGRFVMLPAPRQARAHAKPVRLNAPTEARRSA